jgi:hypothetical protein
MTTEAGKRLLYEWASDSEQVQLEPMVAAIEHEARTDEQAKIRRDGSEIAEQAAAAERERIAAEVEGLRATVVAKRGDASDGSVALVVDDPLVSRAAVLAIVRGEPK